MVRKVLWGVLIGSMFAVLVYAQQRQGRGPGGPGFGPQDGRGPRGMQTSQTPETAPLAKDAQEERILGVLEELDPSRSRGMMNVSPKDGRVLRMLAESLGAKKVVEIGTSNGYSGIWFALGLRNTGGKLITHDIDEGRASLARENFKKAGVEDIVTLVMGDAHETVKQLEGPIDILFLDADKEGYLDYLEQLLPKVRPGGLILAHNTRNAGRGMEGFIEEITTNKDLDTTFIHMDAQGMSITLKKR